MFSCTVHSIKMARCFCVGYDVSETEINGSIAAETLDSHEHMFALYSSFVFGPSLGGCALIGTLRCICSVLPCVC